MFKPSSKLQPVVFGADPALYHAKQKAEKGTPEYVMSRTELELFAACPRKWIRGIPRSVTNAMKWGDVVDVVALTPKNVEKVFAITPDTYETDGMKCPKCGSVTDSAKCAKCKVDRVKSKVTKDWSMQSDTCRSWVESQELSGKRVISKELLSEAWKAHARLKEDEECSAILEASQTQVAVYVDWHDKETGLVIPCKCLLDLVPDPKSEFGDTLWDLKTSASAEPKRWQRQVFNDGLFFQAAMYLDAMNAASGLKYRSFGHIISESDEPYECADRILESEWLDTGRIDYKSALARYCRCMKSGIWPGYTRDLVPMSSWMLKEF